MIISDKRERIFHRMLLSVDPTTGEFGYISVACDICHTRIRQWNTEGRRDFYSKFSWMGYNE